MARGAAWRGVARVADIAITRANTRKRDDKEGGPRTGVQVEPARYDNNRDYRGIREITGKRRARYIIEHWPDTTPWAKCV